MRCFSPRFLLFALCLGLVSSAHAFSRAHRSMGEYLRDSSLVVLADVSSPKPLEIRVQVREVLRGVAPEATNFQIPSGGVVHYIVPREAQNIAILFAPNWQNNSSPVNEVYRQPEEIAALRELIRVYDLPDERARLLALQAHADDKNRLFPKQLVADFERMRDPNNFYIMLSSFPRLEVEFQAQLSRLLGRMGDERALPLLISALRSPDPQVRSSARHSLTYNFPGATGVTDALRETTEIPAPQTMLTPWQKAQQMLASGEKEAAQMEFFSIIQKENGAAWNTLNASRALLPLLDDAGKNRLRERLVQLFERDALDYLQADSAIELLRLLPSERNVPALLHLMHDQKDTPYSFWDIPARSATFALWKLGTTARRQGAARVVEKLKTRVATDAEFRSSEQWLYFCQLVWLADDATWTKVLAFLPAHLSSQMKELQPLRDAATSKTEAASLAALIGKRESRVPVDSKRWIIARLRELRDPVGVAPLFEELEISRFSGNSGDIVAALVAIGGAGVESGALALLNHEHDDIRRSGMDVLREIQGDKMRPLLRRILSEENFGDKSHAVFLLGYIGQPEDLPLLLPLADFWTADFSIQSRASEAVAGIRDRCHYDIHGPTTRK